MVAAEEEDDEVPGKKIWPSRSSLSITWDTCPLIWFKMFSNIYTNVDVSVRQASANNSKSKGLFLLGQRFCFFVLICYTPLSILPFPFSDLVENFDEASKNEAN